MNKLNIELTNCFGIENHCYSYAYRINCFKYFYER